MTNITYSPQFVIFLPEIFSSPTVLYIPTLFMCLQVRMCALCVSQRTASAVVSHVLLSNLVLYVVAVETGSLISLKLERRKNV